MVTLERNDHMGLSLGLAVLAHIALFLPLSLSPSLQLSNATHTSQQFASIALPTLEKLQAAVTQPAEIIPPEPIKPTETTITEPEPVETTQSKELPYTGEWNTTGSRTPPNYPKRALRLGQEGVVLLSAILNTDGHISDLNIKESSLFPLLDQAAIDAVAQWSFLPSEIDGQIRRVRIHIPIEFKIQPRT